MVTDIEMRKELLAKKQDELIDEIINLRNKLVETLAEKQLYLRLYETSEESRIQHNLEQDQRCGRKP
jgi:hypothetical protein